MASKTKSVILDCWESGLIELVIPVQAIKEINRPGDCYEECRHWVSRVRWDHIHEDVLVHYLRPCGAWSEEELEDYEMNKIRTLWLAVWEWVAYAEQERKRVMEEE